MGEMAVDEAITERLLSHPLFSADKKAHHHEHAIEVQLPFLQWINPSVKIVPIVLARLSLAECQEVAEALGEIISQDLQRYLLLASTDMSHYVSADEAKEKDQLALEAVKNVDAEDLYRIVSLHDISMCGVIPTTTVLSICHKLGGERANLLCYGHSGEVTGDLSSVVGYASALIA
jgi:AmmeMemoRadiSam system protein B